jgi:A/G-specific adenine glycosylase
MKSLNKKKVKLLHNKILPWYRKHQRELQWRDTKDPYEILISEIMLQQTQVSRVQEKLPGFLKKFPTVRALAKASRADVILAWQGMGYNNRAVRLREMAKIIVDEHRGKIPSKIEHLRELPGIGPYTSHAVACFAFRKNVSVVDVNIRRILSRLLWKRKTHAEVHNENELWNIATRVLPKDAYEWNQALMDLGATVCTSKHPSCAVCPVRDLCASRHLGDRIRGRLRNKSMKKHEPSYSGTPQRIWRGRIVEALRNVNGTGAISMMQIGRIVKPPFRTNELAWLGNLIAKLEHDGIVDRSNRLVRLSVK